MTQDSQNDAFVKLSEANLTISDPVQDIRGHKVIDQHGDEIGHVSGLFIDINEKKVRLLQVAAGGFLGLGERHFLIPVEAISNVNDDELRIRHTRERVANSPAYNPTLTNRVRNACFWEPYYGYYDHASYWRGGGLGRPLV